MWLKVELVAVPLHKWVAGRSSSGAFYAPCLHVFPCLRRRSARERADCLPPPQMGVCRFPCLVSRLRVCCNASSACHLCSSCLQVNILIKKKKRAFCPPFHKRSLTPSITQFTNLITSVVKTVFLVALMIFSVCCCLCCFACCCLSVCDLFLIVFGGFGWLFWFCLFCFALCFVSVGSVSAVWFRCVDLFRFVFFLFLVRRRGFLPMVNPPS